MRWRAASSIRQWAPQVALGLLGLIALVAVLAVVLKWAPRWLADSDLRGTDRAEDIGRARTALLAALAGLIAITGAAFTGLSYRLNRAAQITERFTRAIDQLGNESLDVRLGGIYTLERIARDSPHDHPQVIEVLTAYVRVHSPWPPLRRTTTHETLDGVGEDDDWDGGSSWLVTDVQAAMSVLARRRFANDEPDTRLDLTFSDLSGLLLRSGDRVHLEGANLVQARLDHAVLRGVHLEGADLLAADLQDAQLQGAHLEDANFRASNLEGAILDGAHLEGAKLSRANGLESSSLADAYWSSATTWPPGFEPSGD